MKAKYPLEILDPMGGVGDEHTEDYAHTCLVKALKNLGAEVSVTRPGPVRALADGNPMLLPLGKDTSLLAQSTR